MNDEGLLQLEDVHAYYGLSHVLQGVTLRVPAGGVVSLMGRNGVGKTTTLKCVFGLVSVRGGRKQAIQQVLSWFPNLEGSLRRPGDQLSGGEQQMLAIARALVAEPRLILVDEPLEGLAPVIAERIEAVLQDLRGKTTVVLVDQNLKWLMQVADHHYVMDHRRIVHHGDSDWLRRHPELIEQYLGIAA